MSQSTPRQRTTRRRFLSAAASVGAVSAAGGAVLARRAYAQNKLKHELVQSAIPMLTTKNQIEMGSLPSTAREEIRDFFHGVCLNSHRFAAHVSSHPFRQKLYNAERESDRQQLMLLAFESTVCGHSEVVNRLWVIAEEAAAEINRNWEICCKDLSERWNANLAHYGKAIDSKSLVDQMNGMIRDCLSQTLQVAQTADRRPALRETADDIVLSALLLSPVFVVSPWAGWPVFAATALAHAFEYVCGLLHDPTPDVQAAVSTRLALLGNRAGSELEAEMRSRLAQLHQWQETAVMQAAAERAGQLLPLV